MISFKKWYIPILSIGFIGFLLIVFLIILAFRPRKNVKSIPDPSGKKVSELNKTPGKNIEPEKKKRESTSFSEQLKLLSAPWGRDPFSLDSLRTKSVETSIAARHGLHTTDGRLLDLNLTGIVFFDNHYMALINDSGVREGDTILGFKVLKIKRDYIVLLDSSGDYYTLDLK